MRPVLGIETSCDETAAAVLDERGHVLAEAVLSQEREHAPYGGVVPEIAARAHLAFLPEQVRGVMTRAGLGFGDLGGVAASAGPGLIGGLIVGSQFAKGIAIAHGLPYVAVNHLEAHALTARLPGLVEGGVAVPLSAAAGLRRALPVRRGGGRRAARAAGQHDGRRGRRGVRQGGEAARAGLAGRPGAGDGWRRSGDPARFAFPRPLLGRPGCDFSFSGLKTAVAQEVARHGVGALPTPVAADIAASFQRAVAEVLADRADARDGDDARAAPDARVAGGCRRRGGERRHPGGAGRGRRGAGFALVAPPGAPVHGQRRDGRLDRDRAAAAGAGGCAGFRATSALAAGEPVNYSHAFHAGNFADCVKHAVLVWLLRALMRKPAPLFVLDTHAGGGRYDLDCGPAVRTGEWLMGIGQIA